MNDLELKIAANGAAQSKLRRRIQILTEQMRSTDWIFTANAPDSRDGISRSDAERQRRQLTEERTRLQSDLQSLESESVELRRQLDELREAAAREQWATASRADLVAAHDKSLLDLKTADTSVEAARAEIERQQQRIAECDSAEAEVVAAHAALVEAQGRAWLQRTGEAEASERTASQALTGAKETAQRAAAARPFLEGELSRAQEALAVAELVVESVRTAETAARLLILKHDWNEAVSKLQPAFAAIAEADRRVAYSLRDAMSRGVPTFNHHGIAERVSWVHEILN